MKPQCGAPEPRCKYDQQHDPCQSFPSELSMTLAGRVGECSGWHDCLIPSHFALYRYLCSGVLFVDRSVTHIIIGASYFLCCVSLTHIEKRLTRSRLPPRVKKPGANCKYYLLFSVYVESCKLIIANICDLLRAKVANRWHLPQSRGATPRSPSVPSSPSFVLFVVVVVVVVVFFLIYGGMRALERRGEI